MEYKKVGVIYSPLFNLSIPCIKSLSQAGQLNHPLHLVINLIIMNTIYPQRYNR